MRHYKLYYYSNLGTQRKPSITNLLLEQKGKYFYNYRRTRESSRRNCNCIFFSDIKKYCFIMPTLVDNTDISIGAVVMDVDEFVQKLSLKDPSEMPNIDMTDVYYKTIGPSLAESGRSLDEINAFRMAWAQQPSWAYLRPLTEEEYNRPMIDEYVVLPNYGENPIKYNGGDE